MYITRNEMSTIIPKLEIRDFRIFLAESLRAKLIFISI